MSERFCNKLEEMKESRGNYNDIISDGGMDPRT